jgi:uncharacterized SAM-binding protein YcdF (DUF218 family)
VNGSAVVGAILLAPIFWLAGVCGLILLEEPETRPARADVAIVLGAAVRPDGAPSPVLAARIDHGVALYRQGAVLRLLFTGGRGKGQPLSEAAVSRAYAARRGVPVTAMLSEERSRTTKQNMAQAQAVMQAAGLRSALLVSDPLHLPRALRMARDVGIDAQPSPTPTSRYRSWWARSSFLLRESFFLSGYWLTGR